MASDRWGAAGYVLHDRDDPPLASNWRRATHAASIKAGLPSVDVHGLRRSAAVKWIAAGFDIYTVSRLLGHASVVTTEHAYASIADSRLTSVFEAMDKRAKVPHRKAA